MARQRQHPRQPTPAAGRVPGDVRSAASVRNLLVLLVLIAFMFPIFMI